MHPTYVYLIASGIIGLILGAILLRLRKVHLVCSALENDLAHSRKEIESLFPQIQALLALERKLALAEALPPMRGWAGSPDFLLAVADAVVSRRPALVVECSSGVSTIVVARCLQTNGTGHVYSLEHDPLFARQTRLMLAKYSLADWATVLDAPLSLKETPTPWYDLDALPRDLPPIDMLIVDGPPGRLPNARAPAFPRLMPLLADRYLIMLDDANRPDEMAAVKRWRSIEPRLTETRIPCEKGLAILELGRDPAQASDLSPAFSA